MKNTSSVRLNANQTMTSMTQYRRARAQDAEIAALRLENDRLRDPELPEYVRLWGIIAKGSGITADQIIDRALLHRDFGRRVMRRCVSTCARLF